MPMDMPPQQVVEYRIQAPTPARDSAIRGVSGFLSGAESQAPQLLRDGAIRNSALPQIDLSSKALTQGDREGLLVAARANGRGTLGSTGVVMPEGYVAERIRTAMRLARLQDRRDPVADAEARAFRCAVVANLMDRRAGAYVKGGERAAAEARASVPRSVQAECRGVAGQAARLSTDGVPSMVRIDGRMTKGVKPVSAAPVVEEKAPVRVDPKPVRLTRIDPEPSVRVRIDPTPSKKVRLDLKGPSHGLEIASVASHVAGGRGRD